MTCALHLSRGSENVLSNKPTGPQEIVDAALEASPAA
jgi:hypothetical protein